MRVWRLPMYFATSQKTTETNVPVIDFTQPEECVGAGCNVVFQYSKGTPIDDPKRLGNYVECVGQLCPRCAQVLALSK